MDTPLGPQAAAPIAGHALPRLIVGTERLGSVQPDLFVPAGERARAFHYLDQLAEAGCTALDTAASYQVGGTERLLGHWLRSRGGRDRLFLISKGAHPWPIVRPNRLTAGDLAHDLHHSLRRLQTNHLDLYLVHRDHKGVALESILEALVGFQRQGKIAAFGVSNWTHQRVAELDALAARAGVPTLAASSPQFSLVDWTRAPWAGSVSIAGQANVAARAWYERRQLPVLAWSPLGRGFFSPSASPRTYQSPANAARRERAQVLAGKYHCTAAQIALAFLFSQPFPVSAVVSSTRLDNIALNLRATTLRLTPGEVGWLSDGEGPIEPGMVH